MNFTNQPQIVSINGLHFEPYLAMEVLTEAFDRVAMQINASYKNRENYPILLITLSGAMAFAAEISKRLDFIAEWGFVKCSSYGGEMNSSCDVKFDIEPTVNLTNRDVIVLEDIVDTGHTWAAINERFANLNLASLTIATMCVKQGVYQYPDLKIDYVGFEVDNKFVIGFGLDYDGIGRNLNGIYKLKE